MKQLQFICLPLDEEIKIRVALRRHIKYLGSFHSPHYCDMKKDIAVAARAYSFVCGVPVHDNHKLNNARLKTHIATVAGVKYLVEKDNPKAVRKEWGILDTPLGRRIPQFDGDNL